MPYILPDGMSKTMSAIPAIPCHPRLRGDVGNGAPWDAHEAPNHARGGGLAMP